MNEDPHIVRADVLQRFTARERMQARLNIRSAKMGDPVQAYVHGLDLVISASSSSIPPALGGGFDDGGVVLVTQTAGGNWSSDGNDTAPLVGPWLLILREETTETVDVPPDEDDPDGFLSESVTTVRWLMEFWDDGAQDGAFAWESESLPLANAEDLFAFRTWTPVPNEEDPYWDEDAVETDSTVWVQPIEPEEEPYSRTNPPAWLLPVFEILPDGTLEMESWFMVPGLEPMSMEIDSYGYLVFSYPDNTTPPDFHISGGNLIVNL